MRDQVPQAPGPGWAQPTPRGGSSRPAKPDRLATRRRYITELLRSQHAMEIGDHALQPLDYRVLSKRLRQALAALPESTARGRLSELPLDLLPLAAEALETRHFERHGELFGLRASLCRDVADELLYRLRRPLVD